MTFDRPPAGDDPHWPRASAWLAAGHDRPRLEISGVPCSIGSISASEAWRTPPAVREALARLSGFEASSGIDLGGLAVRDNGDWPVADLALQDAVDAIKERAQALDKGSVHAFLGGDNAITRPLVAGLCTDLGTVGLVTLDAHHDVRHLGDGPRNGTPVRGLIADGLAGSNVVQIGIGWFTNSSPYAAWCDEQGIVRHSAESVHRRGIDEVLDDALAQLAHCAQIFVDVDMDVLDVAYAPACPGARPGGLDPNQLLTAVRRLGSLPAVAAADFVEVDASRDVGGRTVMVTAQALLAFAVGVSSRPGLTAATTAG